MQAQARAKRKLGGGKEKKKLDGKKEASVHRKILITLKYIYSHPTGQLYKTYTE